MARDLTAGAQTEVAAPRLRPVIFYQGEFGAGSPSEYLRLWSGVGDKAWNSLTWLGAGNLLGMSEIKETAGVVAEGLTLSLSGMPSSLIALVHLSARHGLPGKVWIGFLDAAGAVIADPYQAFQGRLDVPDIVDSGEACTISITYESRLVDLLRPRIWRWTHESQVALYPDDRGFEYVPSLQLQEIEW